MTRHMSNRSWQSLKEQYRRKIIPQYLHTLGLTKKQMYCLLKSYPSYLSKYGLDRKCTEVNESSEEENTSESELRSATRNYIIIRRQQSSKLPGHNAKDSEHEVVANEFYLNSNKTARRRQGSQHDCESASRIKRDMTTQPSQSDNQSDYRHQRKLYSREEDELIVDFLLRTNRYKEVSGITIWKEMRESVRGLQNRPPLSLKERFRKTIINNLHNFELTEEEVCKLNYKPQTKIKTRRSYIIMKDASVIRQNKNESFDSGMNSANSITAVSRKKQRRLLPTAFLEDAI